MFHFPAFPLHTLYIQAGVTRINLARFPHSEILESQPVYRLPEAYRRLPRPSSAPDAKASTIYSYEFEYQESYKNLLILNQHTQKKMHQSRDARVHCVVLNVQPRSNHQPQTNVQNQQPA